MDLEEMMDGSNKVDRAHLKTLIEKGKIERIRELSVPEGFEPLELDVIGQRTTGDTIRLYGRGRCYIFDANNAHVYQTGYGEIAIANPAGISTPTHFSEGIHVLTFPEPKEYLVNLTFGWAKEIQKIDNDSKGGVHITVDHEGKERTFHFHPSCYEAKYGGVTYLRNRRCLGNGVEYQGGTFAIAPPGASTIEFADFSPEHLRRLRRLVKLPEAKLPIILRRPKFHLPFGKNRAR